jgi:polysaccharide biosynthesis transport protein
VVQSSRLLSGTAESEAGYGQLFEILLRRRWWFLGVLCGVVSLSAVVSLFSQPTYESDTQLLLESNYQGRRTLAGTYENPSQQFTDPSVELDYTTQLNLMRSPKLLTQVVRRLKPQYPLMTLSRLNQSLKVSQVVEKDGASRVPTKIVQLVYEDNDPVKTKRVIEELLLVYREYNLEQQQVRLTRGLAFIKSQMPTAEARLAQAEAQLERFRETYNLVDPDKQSSAISESLNTTQQEIRTVRNQYQEAQARYQSLQQQTSLSPKAVVIASRLSQSKRYQDLLSELQKTELTLVQQRVRLTEAAPEVQQLLEKQRNLSALLPQEARRIIGAQGTAITSQDNLVSQGQLSTVEITLANQLLEAQNTLRGLSARDQSLQKAAQQLSQSLGQFPRLLATYERLQPEVRLYRETLDQLRKAQQSIGLEIAKGGFDWQVLEEPRLGLQTSSPLRNILLGTVAGIMLGGIAAFLRDAVDDAVRSSEDLKKQVDIPLLGMVPEFPPEFRKSSRVPSARIAIMDWCPFREAMDLIYQNLQLLQTNSGTPLRSLVITSALAGEGKSTMAIGLALSAARLHRRVLLIDADLRNPTLHQWLNLPNQQGLSQLLDDDLSNLHQSGLQPVSIRTAGCEFDVIPAGPAMSDPAKLLSSQRMRDLVRLFEGRYDLILFDMPPVLGMVDVMVTASFCSGVAMVGRMGTVTRTELNNALEVLDKLNVVGIIANGMEKVSHYYNAYQEKQATAAPKRQILSPSAPATTSLSIQQGLVATPIRRIHSHGGVLERAAPSTPENLPDGIERIRQPSTPMSVAELQQAVEDLSWKVQAMANFIHPQEEELRMVRQAIERLRVQMEQSQGYDRLRLEVQLQSEQERYLFLKETLAGQLQNLQTQRQMLSQHQSLLDRRQMDDKL